jgi:hypothetical protein
MNLIQRFLRSWGGNAYSASNAGRIFRVRCARCGEVIPVRINMLNDLSVEYGDKGEIRGYVCRKLALGTGLCFRQVELSLSFDSNRNLVGNTIKNGELIEE